MNLICFDLCPLFAHTPTLFRDIPVFPVVCHYCVVLLISLKKIIEPRTVPYGTTAPGSRSSEN